MSTNDPSRVTRELGDYFGVERPLVDHIAELLADLDELGSDPEQALRLLGEAGLSPDQRVLDLACGKGAVSVPLAERLGVHVTGVDLYGPFVEAVRAQNARYQGWIEARAARIEQTHPELAESLARYVARELEECRLLEQHVQCATWLLRRR